MTMPSRQSSFPADLAAWDPARLAEQIDAASRAAVTPAESYSRRTAKEGCMTSARQARLVDWLKNPSGVPVGPAIDYSFAAWTAQELVDLTGLYTKRSEALYDLNALRKRNVVVRVGQRWRYHHVWEDTAEGLKPPLVSYPTPPVRGRP